MRKKQHLAIKKLANRLYKKKFSTKQGYLNHWRKNSHLIRRLDIMIALATGKKPPPNLKKKMKKQGALIQQRIDNKDFHGALDLIGNQIKDWGKRAEAFVS